MLPLGRCKTCHQLRLRGPHCGDGLVHNLQPACRELDEDPSSVLGIGDAAYQLRSFETIDTIGHRPGREHTGAVEGRWGEPEWGAGAPQGAQDIEQFPGQAIGLQGGIDPAAYEAGEALEATEDGQRGGIEVWADLAPLPHDAV